MSDHTCVTPMRHASVCVICVWSAKAAAVQAYLMVDALNTGWYALYRRDSLPSRARWALLRLSARL